MKREAWMRPYIRTYLWRFGVTIGLSVLTAVCAGSLMFTSGYLISKAALRPENILMVYVPIVLVRTFGIGRAAVHYLERLLGHDTVLRILANMRVRLYRLLEPQALFIRSRYRTGDVLGTLADDIEQLQEVYVRTVFPTVAAVVMYALFVTVLGWFDWPFALLMALYIFIIVFILPIASLWLMRAQQRQMKRARNGLYRKLTDAVLGMADWVISGRSAQFIQSYEADEVKVAATERKLHSWASFRTGIAQCVVGVAVISTVYWAGQQYADGQLAATMIAAFALVVFPLMDVFLPVSEAMEKVPQYEASLDRINGMSGTQREQLASDRTGVEVDTTWREAMVGASRRLSSHEKTAGMSKPIGKLDVALTPDVHTHIQLERIRFRYDTADLWTLDGVSLDLPQGKKLAVIGRSGAGKSTLLKVIQGVIVPEHGSATINGVRADLFGDDISRVISVLNQRPHLFDTTVANNIRLGRRDASDEAIRQVAKQVQLDALIESLPAGYQTPMLETGGRFSGGERQRIALARILLQDTPVVILDEPTVGLDPRTERDLLRTIFHTVQGKTLIWITHHLVGVEQMDEVIFIENGRIAMRGSHDDLLAQEPRYRRLYQLDRPEGVFV